jgi:aminomethyltransferase
MNNEDKAPRISIGPRVRKSPFFDATLRYGAEAFTVYNHVYMPTTYDRDEKDYWSLVNDVTLWDVTCQRQVEISGPDAVDFIQFLTTRDMSKCEVGQCQYMVLTDEAGGIINDAVMLRIEEDLYWLSPGDGDVLMWAKGVAVNSGMNVVITEPDVSPLQLQGPKAPLVAYDLFGDWALDLKYYRLQETILDGIPLVVSRTGWSGELGYELYLRDGQYGDRLWERIMDAGKRHNIVATAPNMIRSLEGGLLSYVSDITRHDNPYVIGMGKFVDFGQPGKFIGEEALRKISEEGPERRLVGVEIGGDPFTSLNDAFWNLTDGAEKVGHVTRCAYSPRLEKNIGWANVPAEHSEVGTELTLVTPTGTRRARVCKAPWFSSQVSIPEELKEQARRG